MPNRARNKMIGTFIGKVLGYGVQGFAYLKIAKATSPKVVLLLKILKTGTKYGVKFINYAARTYRRTDFSSESIFSDFIDASSSAY